MSAYVRHLALVLAVLGLLAAIPDAPAAAGKRQQRARHQRRSAAAKGKALDTAIKATRTRLSRAKATADAASRLLLQRQAEAGESTGRYQAALSELEQADSEKFGASHELAELRAKIEKFQPEDAPIKNARAEYDAAVEALTEIRLDIYQSDKYQLLYEGAMKSLDKAEELERVTQVCFDQDPDYREARERVERAKADYNRIRYALYEADPDWAPAVERAKAATVDLNQAATRVKASAVESGLERHSLREAAQRNAKAQALLADAQQDLKRLQAQKQRQTKSSSSKYRSKK